MQNDSEHIGFSVLNEAIRLARNNALKVINAELVNLYWQVGAFVSKQLAQAEWGDKSVQKLSDFLLKQDPTLKGFDKRSIYRMVEFFEKYQFTAFVVPLNPQTHTAENQLNSIVVPLEPQLEKRLQNNVAIKLWGQLKGEDIRHTILAKISWSNNLLIFSRCKTEEEREFYIRMCIKENYSKRELDRQISASLFERTMLGNPQLPSLLKKVHPNAIHSFKDSYIFEFLNLSGSYSENDLQKGLIKQMKNLILELGKDFLFIGEEYHVRVGNSDFYIDLLFYHRGLQCLVAFELKADKFKPEHLGQLDFYLEALDRDVKKQNENPSIGILLCKDKDVEVVEYALNRSLSPSLVAEYNTKLPNKSLLQQKLHELFERNIIE